MEYELKVSARMKKLAVKSAKASVHVDIGDWGGFTIINIDVWEQDGKLHIKLPPKRMNGNLRPDITLQGRIKQEVNAAILEEFQRQL